MTEPSSKFKMLVTGASGYIAVHCCKSLLEAGFWVRGTVRSAVKGDYLKDLFEGLGYSGKFEYAIVGDVGEEDAFDEVVKGVHAVEHIASPVIALPSDGAEDIIRPAVNGTIGLLKSVHKSGALVKRVLIVSSIAAVETNHPPPYAFSETDWNEEAVGMFKSLGDKSSGPLVYAVSKVLSERAAWDYMAANKGSLSFDLTTVCPAWVWGPLLQQVSSYEQINGSVRYLLSLWKTPRTNEQLAALHGSYVDVRDCAALQTRLLVADKARNQRVIIAAGMFSLQDILDCRPLPGVPLGNPGATKGQAWEYTFNTEKLENIIGKPPQELFRPLEETVVDTVKSCLDLWPIHCY